MDIFKSSQCAFPDGCYPSAVDSHDQGYPNLGIFPGTGKITVSGSGVQGTYCKMELFSIGYHSDKGFVMNYHFKALKSIKNLGLSNCLKKWIFH